MLSKFPCPRNLTLVVRTKRNHSARHYNIPRARPATISVQYPPSRNGPPNAVNSAFSLMRAAFVDEPRLETKARDKRPPGHTPVHHSVEMPQCIQGFLRSRVALKPDMEDATTDRQAHRRLRENEVVEGGCCCLGGEADGIECPEGEVFRGVCESFFFSRVGGASELLERCMRMRS